MGHTTRVEKSSLVLLLRERTNSCCGGNISKYYENLRSITSDISGHCKKWPLAKFWQRSTCQSTFWIP